MKEINKAKNKNILSSYRFSILLIISIVIGSILGLLMGEEARIFKPLGDIFINLMFTLVVPLVFFTISSSIANMTDMKRLKNILFSLLFVFISTGLVAALIIIFIVKIFPPASGVNIALSSAQAIKPLSTIDQVVSAITVKDFPEIISRKNMLALIIFTIFFGVAVNLTAEKSKKIVPFLDAMSSIFIKMIDILMLYAPIGLGAYFASMVGEYGGQLIGSYARAMLIYYPLCFIYLITLFPLYGYISAGKEGIRALKHVISPAITALATQSSIATLPVNLEASEKIGVPKDIRDIVLPIGATAHMDGTVISTILKISFLFGIFNIPFEGISVYLSCLFLSLAAGVVMSGVPGGGLIGEMFIVTMFGFPPEAFPIIATIGYLVDPPATMINASGDTIASMLVSRIVEGKNWIKNKKENK